MREILVTAIIVIVFIAVSILPEFTPSITLSYMPLGKEPSTIPTSLATSKNYISTSMTVINTSLNTLINTSFTHINNESTQYNIINEIILFLRNILRWLQNMLTYIINAISPEKVSPNIKRRWVWRESLYVFIIVSVIGISSLIGFILYRKRRKSLITVKKSLPSTLQRLTHTSSEALKMNNPLKEFIFLMIKYLHSRMGDKVFSLTARELYKYFTKEVGPVEGGVELLKTYELITFAGIDLSIEDRIAQIVKDVKRLLTNGS